DEGALNADVWRTVSDWLAALNAADWDLFASLIADDIKVSDRRRVSFGDFGKDQLVELERSARELTPDRRWIVTKIEAIDENGVVFESLITGTMDEDVEVEVVSKRFVRVRDGRLTIFEMWDADALDEALARFEELRSVQLRNMATEVTEVMLRA